MAQSELDSSWASSTSESFSSCFNLDIGERNPSDVLTVPEVSTSSIPKPPPLPGSTCSKAKRFLNSSYVPKETKDTWDKIFNEGFGVDVHIITDDQITIPAHSIVLGTASLVLRNSLKEAKVKDGIRCIKISGVPSEAVHTFIRFLYSACYEEDEMRKFVLHLLALSHSYSVPPLKRVCTHLLEQAMLTTENTIDVLQLARLCDAPRLSLICVRMVVNDFKRISATEGWKVMKRVDPALEQELLESVVEADTKKQEKMKKIEEKKMYLQLNEAMEALLHICRDGCRTIGPRDKMLKGTQIACGFPACKGLEALVRHFSICKTRVPGGCVHCKRMWQLFELHSRMCNEPDSCKVPLCRHFKEKMQHQSKKDEAKWKLLVSKVIAAKPR
ncbi:zinc finger protein [Macleaya cordata]|uniref:Zinc finger protein n=1 Tax=Macleaya cordata TaxID=56857 RepID=A0A200QJQ5_MACCD|nr:zinc finger protein [Macleaya cordata]